MPGTLEDKELRERIRRIESLLQEADRFKDPEARAITKEVVKALMDFHGAALERMLENLASTGEAGLATIHTLAGDDLVANLLMLYGLHPLGLEARVLQALDKCRPYLQSHGGNVELLGIDDGIVRLRLQGSCHGCPSSAQTLKQTIEEAILEKAPDAAAIEVEGEITGHEDHPIEEHHGNRINLPVLAG